jgi:hypothetical protein
MMVEASKNTKSGGRQLGPRSDMSDRRLAVRRLRLDLGKINASCWIDVSKVCHIACGLHDGSYRRTEAIRP